MSADILQKREELLCRADRAIEHLVWNRHINKAAIMILATTSMLNYIEEQAGRPARSFPLGQIVEYRDVTVMPVYSIDQEDVMQPVVMYNGVAPRVDVGTVVCDTAHYDNGSMFDNLFVVVGYDEYNRPCHFEKYDVRFDTPPIEGNEPFDNEKPIDFLSGMRG